MVPSGSKKNSLESVDFAFALLLLPRFVIRFIRSLDAPPVFVNLAKELLTNKIDHPPESRK
jgi:hypothetical protein